MPKVHCSDIRRRTLIAAALGAGAVAVQSPARGATGEHAMPDDLTPDEIRNLLQLEPNATCGYVKVTFHSALNVPAGALPAPFADGRPLGSALYFMVTPDQHVKLHRIRNEQLYHYYLGDPLEVFLLHAGGKAERVVVGPDLRAGHRVPPPD